MQKVAVLPVFSRFQDELSRTCLSAAGLRGTLVYMAISLIGAWLRAMPPMHLTLVRTIRIGWPQQA